MIVCDCKMTNESHAINTLQNIQVVLICLLFLPIAYRLLQIAYLAEEQTKSVVQIVPVSAIALNPPKIFTTL